MHISVSISERNQMFDVSLIALTGATHSAKDPYCFLQDHSFWVSINIV